MTWNIYNFPPKIDLESRKVLKALVSAHQALAELKSIVKTIPNDNVLLKTLPIKEARDSSAIENIVTTQDELFRASLSPTTISSLEIKKVKNYEEALFHGFKSIALNDGILTNREIIAIQEILEKNHAGLRKLPGTSLKNALTGEVIYTPPRNHDEIQELLSGLEKFVNDDELSDLDELVKMSIIHFQFESIHPFYDGNGRTGRIINILYLIQKGLLDSPVLYLSKYIIENKGKYYSLLQGIRDDSDWESWILFMIKGVEVTAKGGIQTIQKISELMKLYKRQIKDNFKFYSHDLLNCLFMYPYTKIEFLMGELNISRVTASSYLNQLSNEVSGVLKKKKIGNTNYYINEKLLGILTDEEYLA